MHSASMGTTSLPHPSPQPRPPLESPPLWELMKNQVVVDLCVQNCQLNTKINSLHDRVSECVNRFHKLWTDYDDIKEQNFNLLQEIKWLRELKSDQVPETSIAMSRESSLAPSDSISQAPHRKHAHSDINSPACLDLVDQPALRPSQYPLKILWDREDAAADIVVGVSKTNKSRPSMKKSIRNTDGTVISLAQWRAIRGTAIVAVRDILHPLVEKAEALGHRRPFGKRYYKKHWRKQWEMALAQVEWHEPLLRLCSNHWKAEHILSLFLSSADTTDKPEDSMEDDSMPPSAPSRKRKSNCPPPLQCKKNKA